MDALDSSDLKNILRITEIAYSASDIDAFGLGVLHAVIDSVGAEKGVFMLQLAGENSPRFFYHGIEPINADSYVSSFYLQDPLHLLHNVSNHIEVSPEPRPNRTINLRDVVSIDDFVRTDYYKEFYLPQGIYHEIATCLESSLGTRGVLDILRSKNSLDFGEREIVFMNCLAPHLARALDSLGTLRPLGSTTHEPESSALEGLLLCNQRMRVVYANELGRNLLKSMTGSANDLTLHPTLCSRLDLQVADMSSGGGGKGIPVFRVMNVNLNSGCYRFEISSSPCTREDTNEPLYAILIKKYEQDYIYSSERNFEEYGLTTREIEVVKKLFEGKSNRQISEELFVTEFTIKKHIQHICAKLNVKSRTSILSILHNPRK